jgi:NAD(P)-dependent dehydrogenase (short-subunit alcohol dehydrogenase family)
MTFVPVVLAGTATFVVQHDASDPFSCKRFASWAHNHLPAVHVFAHAAGVPAFDLIIDMDWKQFADVVSPKVGKLCSQNLHV